MAFINNNRKKLSLDNMAKIYHIEDYRNLVHFVEEQVKDGNLVPVKSSGLNGKNPALYRFYKIITKETDCSEYIQELQFQTHTALETDYYMKHMDNYKEDREQILALSNYLDKHREALIQPLSYNERSFEIWGREKFLKQEGGLRILKNLGLSEKDLNLYETTEPLAYYSHHKDTPQNILILENKDTFYSMRRHLLSGKTSILEMPVGTLIYGGGKKIIKAFQDFDLCAEPYLNSDKNSLYYLGDLDYEGILIYETLKEAFGHKTIEPFCTGYLAMLKKGERYELPYTKEGQNRNIGDGFLKFFSDVHKEQILAVLTSERYIPQEILNLQDF